MALPSPNITVIGQAQDLSGTPAVGQVVAVAQTTPTVAYGYANQPTGVASASGSGLLSLAYNAGTGALTGSVPVQTFGTVFNASGAALNVSSGGTGATSLSGILKGNGTAAFTAAVAGTDYLTPTGSGTGLSGVALLGASNTFTQSQNLSGGMVATTGAFSGNVSTGAFTSSSALINDASTTECVFSVGADVVIGYVSLIPSPNTYSVSASSENYGAATSAFDKNSGTAWWTGGLPAWLQIDFGAAKVVNKYSINGGNNYAPASAWTLGGSNDNSTWTTLDTQSGQNVISEIDWVIPNTSAYRYYRLTVTIGSDNYIHIAELDLLSNSTATHLASQLAVNSGTGRAGTGTATPTAQWSVVGSSSAPLIDAGTVAGSPVFSVSSSGGITATTGAFSGNVSATGVVTAANFTGITETIGVTVNNNGSVITTGTLGNRPLAHNYTITGYQIIADVSGSITFSIGTCTFANYPTFTSIVASAPPALSSAQSVASTTLTGWTTTLVAGGFLQFGVTSATTVTNVTLVLQVVRS